MGAMGFWTDRLGRKHPLDENTLIPLVPDRGKLDMNKPHIISRDVFDRPPYKGAIDMNYTIGDSYVQVQRHKAGNTGEYPYRYRWVDKRSYEEPDRERLKRLVRLI
jgi:hypothetical protein